MGTDAACLAELQPVQEGETAEATLGEIATEFTMERADAHERLDIAEAERDVRMNTMMKMTTKKRRSMSESEKINNNVGLTYVHFLSEEK